MGKILILKLSLAVVMIIFGGYHEFITSSKVRNILIKKIGGEEELMTTVSLSPSLRRFYILLRIESFVGIALLFVVSLMTNMVLPSGQFQTSDNNNFAISQETNLIGDQANSISANNEYLTDIYSNNQTIQVKLEPASLGENTITVSFIDLSSGQNDVYIQNTTLKLNHIEKMVNSVGNETHLKWDIFTTLPIRTLGVWSFEIQGKTLKPNTPNTIGTFNIDIKPVLSDLEINLTEYPLL